jgi:hypothetical protein
METDRINKKLERLRSSFISLLVEQQIEISALQSASALTKSDPLALG